MGNSLNIGGGINLTRDRVGLLAVFEANRRVFFVLQAALMYLGILLLGLTFLTAKANIDQAELSAATVQLATPTATATAGGTSSPVAPSNTLTGYAAALDLKPGVTFGWGLNLLGL